MPYQAKTITTSILIMSLKMLNIISLFDHFDPCRKKRKFELARPPAMTKLAPQRIHTLRTRGGNKKYRALRLPNSWNL